MTQESKLDQKKFLKSIPFEYRKIWQDVLSRERKIYQYRQILLKQNDNEDNCFVIISGKIKITKTINYKQHSKLIVIGQIEQYDIVGGEWAILNQSQKAYYTYTVNNSKSQCIRINKFQIDSLILRNKGFFLQKQKRKRQFYLSEQEKFINQNNTSQQRKLQKNLFQLELPKIIPINTSMYKKSQSQNFFRKKRNLINLSQPLIQVPIRQIKKISLSKEKKEIDREKLFKQNLKNIIRRKISYETKQFAILKMFRQIPIEKIEKTTNNKKKVEQVSNPINKFFNFSEWN